MRRGLIALLAVALATCAGIAAASELVVPSAPVVVDPEPPALLPGPAEPLTGAVADDPDGGPQWAVRTYVSQTQLLCAEAGRLYAGIFGDLDDEGRFVPRPNGPTGTCGDGSVDPLIAAARRVAAHAGRPARTIVFGASEREPRGIELEAGDADAPRALPIGARGSFIGVLEGLREGPLVLVARLADGQIERVELGP
jgi:hypothetical protein